MFIYYHIYTLTCNNKLKIYKLYDKIVLVIIMFSFFKKKRNPVLKEMDGREVKYVTRRVHLGNSQVREEILGKDGRIVLIEEEIRILCGEIDVFKGDVNTCEYFRLMSGDGITVSGYNSVIEKDDIITVYYKYHR